MIRRLEGAKYHKETKIITQKTQVLFTTLHEMKDEILKEIIPLTQSDCFTVFSRVKNNFDFPLHYHDELELNLIVNGKGAQRVIGDQDIHLRNFKLYRILLCLK